MADDFDQLKAKAQAVLQQLTEAAERRTRANEDYKKALSEIARLQLESSTNLDQLSTILAQRVEVFANW